MKTQIQFRLFIVLLFISTAVFANTPAKKKTEKSKTITKSFNVASNATLKVDNAYGNIDVATWDKNKIDIEVKIKVTGNNADKVAERLERISVDFTSTNSLVTAKTIIDKNKKNWWSWNGNKKMSIEINYIIKMPMTNNVDFSNDYGSINIDKLEGKAKLSCDYGKITTKELMADDNEISFDYSNNCYFEYIKSGRINADYSGFTVAKTKNLRLNADYTKSTIEVAENVDYNCDYGSVKIGKVNNIQGNGDYLTLRLGNVYKNVSIKADYGSVKIDEMAANAGNVSIQSDYVGITIGYNPGYDFNFDLDLEYGGLSGASDFYFTTKSVDGSDKKYEGYKGDKGSGNLISVKSDYGSVTFKEK